MYIDKYKKDDGYYYDDNKSCYEDAETFYRVGVFGFCSCGFPKENLRYIRDGLAHIDVEYDRRDNFYDRWKREGLEIFGNEKSEYFFYYWCDIQKLTEHGACVPGWLSKKGKRILADLNEILNEKK